MTAKRGRPRTFDYAEAAVLRQSGWSLERLAAYYGKSPAAVLYALRVTALEEKEKP